MRAAHASRADRRPPRMHRAPRAGRSGSRLRPASSLRPSPTSRAACANCRLDVERSACIAQRRDGRRAFVPENARLRVMTFSQGGRDSQKTSVEAFGGQQASSVQRAARPVPAAESTRRDRSEGRRRHSSRARRRRTPRAGRAPRPRPAAASPDRSPTRYAAIVSSVSVPAHVARAREHAVDAADEGLRRHQVADRGHVEDHSLSRHPVERSDAPVARNNGLRDGRR